MSIKHHRINQVNAPSQTLSKQESGVSSSSPQQSLQDVVISDQHALLPSPLRGQVVRAKLAPCVRSCPCKLCRGAK